MLYSGNCKYFGTVEYRFLWVISGKGDGGHGMKSDLGDLMLLLKRFYLILRAVGGF